MTYVLLIVAMLGGGLEHRGIITGFEDLQQCEAARAIAEAEWAKTRAKAAVTCVPADEA